MAKSKEDEVEWDLVFEEWWNQKYKDDILYIVEWESFVQYEMGVYKPIAKVYLEKIFKDYLRAEQITLSKYKLSIMFTVVSTEHPEKLSEFDCLEGWINFRNGFYDIHDHKLYSHDENRDYKSMVQYDVYYMEEPEETPFIDEFRSNYFEQLWWIERFVQSMLYRDFKHEQMLNLLGPSRAGKGTILNLINAVFGSSITNGKLHKLGGEFGLWPLVNKIGFLDKEMKMKGFNDDTIEAVKTITGLDYAQGTSINKKGIPQYDHPIKAFIITAANQFGVLPEGVDELAWFCRTNIQVFDKSFPSNDAMKDGILDEVHSWISELLLIPYHNWADGMDKVNDWAPIQRELWQKSSHVYKNMLEEHFEYKKDCSIKCYRVVNFFRYQLAKEHKTVPNEKRLMSIITTEMAAIGVVKRVVGHQRQSWYMNLAPRMLGTFEAVVGEDTDEDMAAIAAALEMKQLVEHGGQ